MKKLFSIFSVLTIYLLSVSAHSERVFDNVEGSNAPLFTVKDDSGLTVSLESFKGKYLLLSFWNSVNPESRIKVNQFETIVSNNSEANACLLAVNLDENIVLYNQIKKIDNLNEGVHINVSNEQRNILNKLYHLDSGLTSYLIDPQGKIVAVNPTKEQIVRTIKN